MKVRVPLALAALLVASPAWSQVSLGLEATVGGQHLGVTRVPGPHDLSPMGDIGATIFLRAGLLGIGVAGEGNFQGRTFQRFNSSLLAGLVTDLLPVLRLELLGEVGAANLKDASEIKQAASSGDWNRFYGFRPGLSAKLPVLPFRVGVWGLARWGLPGTTKGPELGMLGRVGLEF